LELREQALRALPVYLAIYLVFTFVLFRTTGDKFLVPAVDEPEDRFGGLLGPQVCAFALAIVFAFLWFSNRRPAAMICLLGIAVTGSRTYTGIAALVLVVAWFLRKARPATKIIAAVALVAFMIAAVAVLPRISDRFIMDEDFYGTLLGRFLNYSSAVDHI